MYLYLYNRLESSPIKSSGGNKIKDLVNQFN